MLYAWMFKGNAARCHDKEDGDLTSQITTWGINEVNVHKPGTYHIPFFCADTGGHQVQTGVKAIVKGGGS